MSVWTFLIVGGQNFRLVLSNQPPLTHDGRRTIWKMIATEDVANQTASAIRALGASVTLYTETQE